MDVNIKNIIEAIEEFAPKPCGDECEKCPLSAKFDDNTICTTLLRIDRSLKTKRGEADVCKN